MEMLDPLTLYILKTKKAEYGLYLYEFGRRAELYKRKKRSFSKICWSKSELMDSA